MNTGPTSMTHSLNPLKRFASIKATPNLWLNKHTIWPWTEQCVQLTLIVCFNLLGVPGGWGSRHSMMLQVNEVRHQLCWWKVPVLKRMRSKRCSSGWGSKVKVWLEGKLMLITTKCFAGMPLRNVSNIIAYGTDFFEIWCLKGKVPICGSDCWLWNTVMHYFSGWILVYTFIGM